MALIARDVLGIAVLLLIAFIFSTNRRAIRLRTVSSALLAQFCIGAFILFVPLGKTILAAAAAGVNNVLGYGNAEYVASDKCHVSCSSYESGTDAKRNCCGREMFKARISEIWKRTRQRLLAA